MGPCNLFPGHSDQGGYTEQISKWVPFSGRQGALALPLCSLEDYTYQLPLWLDWIM